MPRIEIQFGAGGVSVERDFDVAPRIGEIVHITRGGEDFHLLIDLAQHSEGPDDQRMEYFVHGHVIEDLAVEMKRKTGRARD